MVLREFSIVYGLSLLRFMPLIIRIAEGKIFFLDLFGLG